jgi:dihydropteroate synthase
MSNARFIIRHSTFSIPPSPPLVMGILNVTPDSFSDGGDYFTRDAAGAHALNMIAEGADIIDIGGESTRPGAEPTPAEEQIRRAIPVIRAIRTRNSDIAISIDTRAAAVARAAVDAGSDIINDVSALRDDPAMADVVAASGAAVVLMHRRGTSADMQDGGGPHYDDVIAEITAFLQQRRDFAAGRGIDRSRIILDPGLGFGKRVEHNLTILRHLDRLVALEQPVLVGASRKRFLGSVLGVDEPKQRLAGSLTCAVIAALAGAAILRVHDVRATVDAVQLCSAVHGE